MAADRRPSASVELVDTPERFAALVESLSTAGRYALDTEFHRERTYWPKPALVQLAWQEEPCAPSRVALVDPLAVEVSPLAEVLSGPGEMVAHACEQDLEILERLCGTGPARLFDTQVAAGFAGHPAANLASLVKAFLRVDLLKGNRLTDWTSRPLTAAQQEYAAADVSHLLPLADAIADDLDRSGRRGWAEEECEALLRRPHGPPDPRRAWWKLRDARSLKGPARGVAQEVAAWREERARSLDVPVRTVLPDLALQAIAHQAPSGAHGLSILRGMEGRSLRPAAARELLDAVERGRRLPADLLCLPPAEEVPRELRGPVGLVMAWIAQLARSEGIDPSLLATRADVASYLRGDPTSRLSHGWRAAMVAVPVRALVEGRASLAFDGAGSLVLEERSGRPFTG
jgi:ribonuclease D